MTKYQVTFKKALLVLSCCWAVWTPMVPAATLNEQCVVSVLNRTVQVKPDGTWVLPNIPANFGPVRARATCVQDGATLSGQSEFFTIPANGSTDVPEIVLGPTTPIPNQITVTASTATLTQAGQTAQLTVTGHYADGSSQDLGNSAAGTQFLASNPQLATVSANGLVTALQSGTVLIQAINEGAQGLLSMSIALSSDTDGDGILDDIELREGLDPNNPADALDDADRDGLTNKEELQRGTDLHKADSDGDGLLDGEEIKLGTNPLLKDTDGDSVPDNIEAATGSDPLNPLSFNLAKALKGIKVSPLMFTITVNTAELIAYQQLEVTGEFALGGTITLTAKAKGTSYSSSDLQVCNFGVEDGRVYGGRDSKCTITVSNSGFTATAVGTVITFAPQALSYVSIPGFANNVEVNGNYAYVAAGSTGLQIVDIADRAKPKVVASLDTPGNANDVAVAGDYAYIADGASGLQIIDIVNPLAPIWVGAYDTTGIAWDVVVSGGHAFIADGSGGLSIISVGNPAFPSQTGTLPISGTAKGVDVDLARQLAVVAMGTGGVRIINIADLSAPAIVGSLTVSDVRDIALGGNYAFLADYARSFTVVDISNPSKPVVGASTPSNLGGQLQDVVLNGNFALGADTAFVNHVPVFDIGNPSVPQIRAIVSFSDFRADNGTGIAADGSYIYLTAGPTSENGIIGDTRLYIGQYRALKDHGGITPTVAITSPLDGDSVIQGSQISISAQAADDVGVAAVNFNVNGSDVFMDTSAPYEASYAVPDDVSSLTISADAVDLAGNQTVSSVAKVTAIPDPLTTVVGNVVDLKRVPIANAKVTCLNTEAYSDANGHFVIFGLPTIRGEIICNAEYIGADKPMSAFSRSYAPVRGSNTDVGTIYMSAIANSGRDFWVANQFAVAQAGSLQLIVLAEKQANFTVTSTGYSFTGSASPQLPATVPIPSSFKVTSNQVIESKGIHIVSDTDISVILKFSTEMALAIPTQALGKEYIAVGYNSWYLAPAHFLMVGTEDATQIRFITSCQSTNGTPKEQTIEVTLNAGQTYQYLCSNIDSQNSDITGSRITSNKPIAVIAGAGYAIPPLAGEYNTGFEMMFPIETLYGNEFYSVPIPDGRDHLFVKDIFRIMAASDDTTVTVDDGSAQNTYQLEAGQFQEIRFRAGAHFTSNQPISVNQYSVYRFCQVQLIPTHAYKPAYRLWAKGTIDYLLSDGTRIKPNFALIVAPNEALASVVANGQPVTNFQPLPGGMHHYAIVDLPTGQSAIDADRPVGVYVYGEPYNAKQPSSITWCYPGGFQL